MQTIDFWSREGWHTIGQDGGISTLQQQAQLPPQLPHSFIRFGRGRRPESCCDPSIVKEPNIIHIATKKQFQSRTTINFSFIKINCYAFVRIFSTTVREKLLKHWNDNVFKSNTHINVCFPSHLLLVVTKWLLCKLYKSSRHTAHAYLLP